MNFTGHNVRHGDLALIGINKLPEGLTASESKVLMTGSGGNDHLFDKGQLFKGSDDQFVCGYLVADKGAKLLHPDHGKKVKGQKLLAVSLPEGIYEARRQNEETHESFRQVVD